MVIDELRKGRNFTENEKIISEFILNHPEEFQKMSSEELGRVTFTSKSTVIRLCKKLNVLGYQDLKKVLYSEYNQERILGKEELCPTLGKTSSYEDISKLIPEVYRRAADEVSSGNNQKVINRIMNRIHKVEKIEFYSTGIGYSILQTAAHKFNSIGIESSVSSTVNESYLISAKKRFTTMAFVVSLTGNNPFVIHAAEVLKHLGIYVVGVVGQFSNEISRYCDEVISLQSDSLVKGMVTISKQYSINYIFDMIFTKMLANQYEEIIEREKKINYDYDRDIFNADTKVSINERK